MPSFLCAGGMHRADEGLANGRGQDPWRTTFVCRVEGERKVMSNH
jgi:hypothetical protein